MECLKEVCKHISWYARLWSCLKLKLFLTSKRSKYESITITNRFPVPEGVMQKLNNSPQCSDCLSILSKHALKSKSIIICPPRSSFLYLSLNSRCTSLSSLSTYDSCRIRWYATTNTSSNSLSSLYCSVNALWLKLLFPERSWKKQLNGKIKFCIGRYTCQLMKLPVKVKGPRSILIIAY